MTKSMNKRLDKDEARLEATAKALSIVMSKVETLVKELEQVWSTLEKRFASDAGGRSDERVAEEGNKEWWSLWSGPATKH
jgi:hypothetical protein